MMNKERIILEVCCDSLESVRAAAAGGADRIELCRDLHTDGLTPSRRMLLDAKSVFAGPVNVLIRLREGDFVYTDEEIGEMCKSIRELPEADGYVVGALTTQGEVDVDAVKRMVGACAGKPVTFHRAFDRTANPVSALEDVVSCGCRRILTSGCHPTAKLGVNVLAELKNAAHGRILILAGGGVNPANLSYIIDRANPDEVHGSLSRRMQDGSAVTDIEAVRMARLILENK